MKLDFYESIKRVIQAKHNFENSPWEHCADDGLYIYSQERSDSKTNNMCYL